MTYCTEDKKMSSDGGKKQFWKRNTAKVPGSIQHVYGAQHPPFDPLLHANLIKAGNKPPSMSTPGKPKKATTFQEFESITSDAWDVGDDDDELLAMAAQNLNIEVVMETANKVIENHSKLQERRQQRQDDMLKPEEKEEEEAREEDVDERGEEEEEEAAETTAELSFSFERLPHSDSRLVKSHSEAPIGSPKVLAEERAALQRQQSLPHRPVIPLVARMADQNTSGTPAMTEREAFRLDKFRQLLAGPNTDLEELRKLSWSGIPRQVRPITWKLLSGYLPANAERRASTLQRKRQEYFGFIEQYYDSRNDEHHQDTYRQIHIDIPRMSPESLVLQPKVTEIHIDIPRTNPLIPLFQQASVQEMPVMGLLRDLSIGSRPQPACSHLLPFFHTIALAGMLKRPLHLSSQRSNRDAPPDSPLASGATCHSGTEGGPANETQSSECSDWPLLVPQIFERILFIWAIRHPASGYVQGINDLVTPFFVVYVFEYIEPARHSLATVAVTRVCHEEERKVLPEEPGCISILLWGAARRGGPSFLHTPPPFHPAAWPTECIRRGRVALDIKSSARSSQLAAPTCQEEEVENFDVSSLQEEVLRNIEADSFWCMSKLLDGIQDNYTFAQPGIQRKVKALEELVSRIDETVHRHMQQYEVEYLQFAFRWMNNLLMRELPLRCTIRLWDTYQVTPPSVSLWHSYQVTPPSVSLWHSYQVTPPSVSLWHTYQVTPPSASLWDTYQAEPEGFSHFHLYVCAAFLVHWRKEILEEKDFQGLMILLQNLPTMHWGNEEPHLSLTGEHIPFAHAVLFIQACGLMNPCTYESRSAPVGPVERVRGKGPSAVLRFVRFGEEKSRDPVFTNMEELSSAPYGRSAVVNIAAIFALWLTQPQSIHHKPQMPAISHSFAALLINSVTLPCHFPGPQQYAVIEDGTVLFPSPLLLQLGEKCEMIECEQQGGHGKYISDRSRRTSRRKPFCARARRDRVSAVGPGRERNGIIYSSDSGLTPQRYGTPTLRHSGTLELKLRCPVRVRRRDLCYDAVVIPLKYSSGSKHGYAVCRI
ncbi:hypothetical protein P4O66_014420 [Electrophorus voltai]|uniref:Rab-GAP TBC domain-containing protein n=1 Tax=Electrophorus voltai TaxID=2609070 RepID=A0AAD9DRJ0_9TELE|nr:hypothetical protein P4O66_014420 [Electrophorus voltai]